MASATITLLNVCSGGEHVNVRLAVGAQNFDFSFPISDLIVPISAEERQIVTSVITRFHCQGLTKAQAKTELTSPGISVVTS